MTLYFLNPRSLVNIDQKLAGNKIFNGLNIISSEHEGLRAFELNLAEAVRHSVSGFNKGNANSREVLAPSLPFSRANDDECVPPLEYDQKVIKSTRRK